MIRSVVVVFLALATADARAEDEMSTFKARVETAGWALPTLTLHVVLHEGSHYWAAKLRGADAVDIEWLPPWKRGRGALAWTGWIKRNKTRGDSAFVGFAPIVTNLVTLASYAALFEAGIPSNEHVRIPLAMMAGWSLSDLVLGLFPMTGRGGNHVEGVYDYFRLSTVQRLPFRVAHVGLVVLGYLVLKRSADSIYDEQDVRARAVVIPFSRKF